MPGAALRGPWEIIFVVVLFFFFPREKRYDGLCDGFQARGLRAGEDLHSTKEGREKQRQLTLFTLSSFSFLFLKLEEKREKRIEGIGDKERSDLLGIKVYQQRHIGHHEDINRRQRLLAVPIGRVHLHRQVASRRCWRRVRDVELAVVVRHVEEGQWRGGRSPAGYYKLHAWVRTHTRLSSWLRTERGSGESRSRAADVGLGFRPPSGDQDGGGVAPEWGLWCPKGGSGSRSGVKRVSMIVMMVMDGLFGRKSWAALFIFSYFQRISSHTEFSVRVS